MKSKLNNKHVVLGSFPTRWLITAYLKLLLGSNIARHVSIHSDQHGKSPSDPTVTALLSSGSSPHGLLPNSDILAEAEISCRCLRLYQQENWKDTISSEHPGTDSAKFTHEDFATIDDTNQRRLCNLLRNKVVFVSKGRNVNISKLLVECEKIKLLWSESDTACTFNNSHTGKYQCQIRHQPFHVRSISTSLMMFVATVDLVTLCWR